MPLIKKKRNTRRGRAATSSSAVFPFQSILTQVALSTPAPSSLPELFSLQMLLPEFVSSSQPLARLVRLVSFTVRFYPTQATLIQPTQGTYPGCFLASVQLFQVDLVTNVAVPKTNVIPLSTTSPRTLSFRATGSRWMSTHETSSQAIAGIGIARSITPDAQSVYCDITTTFLISRDGLGGQLTTKTEPIDFEPLPTVQQVTKQMSRVFRK